MPRSTHEPSRDSAARATDPRSENARSDRRTGGGEDMVTDEGLGLLPTGQRTGPLGDATAPSGQAEVIDAETDLTTTPHLLDGADAAEPDLEPSLMDQEILTDPMAAAGGPDDVTDPVAEGDEVYVPPTDPVIGADPHGEPRVLGGFSTSADGQITPKRSASDGQIGDEALVDAVQSALRHDAATADLVIDVTVEGGIVRLSGRVPGLEDVDNAEAVAGRVMGVVDIVEELQVLRP
jgi:hypothetical protein